jgi:hypothetical protein
MILYKSWLDTRWRFIVGAAILACSVTAMVLLYPQVTGLLPVAASIEVPGALGEEVRKAIDLISSFDGYLWLKWYNGNMPMLASLFASMLGAGGIFTAGAGGGALYTLALPVSRRRLLILRAITGLAELLGLMMLASLALPLLAPAIGESVSFQDAAVHGFCAFIAGSLFFSLALFLATVFSDVWRPLLIAIAIASLAGLAEMIYQDALSLGVIHTMSAATYHETGALPWPGLLICILGSSVLIFAAIQNLERRNF